jgi:hypothetical protein
MSNQPVRRLFSGMIVAVTLMLSLLAGSAGVASAQSSCYPTCKKTTPPPAQITKKPQAAAPAPVTTPSKGLAFTGSDIAGTAVFAVALIGGGVALVRVSRRHRAA